MATRIILFKTTDNSKRVIISHKHKPRFREVKWLVYDHTASNKNNNWDENSSSQTKYPST